MASTTGTTATTTGTTATEYKASPPRVTTRSRKPVVVEVILRVVLLLASVAAVVVMVTSKETELIPISIPPFRAPNTSRFTDSPAFVYFVAALSTAGLYSIITTLFSITSRSNKLTLHIVATDAIMLAIVAAAAGTAGGVAYIGLKGNSHSRWNKICNIYDTFCVHVASAIGVSLFASIVLILLIFVSSFTLYRRIPN